MKTLIGALVFCCYFFVYGSKKPNIIMILADDMGLDSISTYNSELGFKTPRIDQLIAEGLSFNDGHSNSAVCTPTRYGLLTGRYSWRSRLKRGIVPKWDKPLIEKGRLTMASMLKEVGYNTACIGKWHLGWNWPFKEDASQIQPGNGREFAKLAKAGIAWGQPLTGGPLSVGFDYHFGDDVINWPPFVYIENEKILGQPNPQKGYRLEDDGWIEDEVLPVITQKTVEYIHAKAKEDKPFFVYFPMTSPHSPISPADEFKGKSGISTYVDFVIETDHRVGQIMDAVKESSIEEDTLVIFSADNGTALKLSYKEAKDKVNYNTNLRGGKADIYEGGHRVPFVFSWKGKIKPGQRNDTTVCMTDILATLAELVDYTLPENAGEDSFSLAPILKGASKSIQREPVIHHSISGLFAIRDGDYKLMFSRGSGGWSAPNESEAKKQNMPELQLYHLKDDPKETKNLSQQKPELVKSMSAKLSKLIQNGRSNPGKVQKNVGTTWMPSL